MYEKVYLIGNRFESGTYFGCTSGKKSVVFAFRTPRYVDYVRQHIRYKGIQVDEIHPNRYLLKSHYNSMNSFDSALVLATDELYIKEKRLYSLVLNLGVNDVSVGLVESVQDREDGDIDLCVRHMRQSMPQSEEVIKFNLELLLKA
jgi:hypothetical protein